MKQTSSKEELASLVDNTDGIELDWQSISYSVEGRPILYGLNGNAKSGEMLAILGPTGCGKTSLLNVLAARTPFNKKAALSGRVNVNGCIRDESAFRRISAYVLQDDLLYPHLTVYETLFLAAQFLLPSNLSEEKRESVVVSVIKDLGLSSCKDTMIGDEKVRGVSGGERKRTSIAVQLISNPDVFFLDEPTSGLDSFQAQSVMTAMRSLASIGKLVVSVIHQPRSSIFTMFDRLLLLSEGRTMFMGDASQATAYFEAQGHPCPKLFNPSDFFLDILSPDTRTGTSRRESSERIRILAASWAARPVAMITANAQTSAAKTKDQEYVTRAGGNDLTLQRLAKNFRLLCWRTLSEQLREVPTIAIRMTITVIFSLIIAGMYSDVGYDQAAINNRTGLLFVIAINQGFNALMAVLNVFPKEKLIVSRERSSNAYDTFSYFVAKYMCELPLNVLPCTVFGSIIYWIVGLNPEEGRFGNFVAVLMMEAAIAVALGLSVSACAPTVEAAVNFGPLTLIISLLFGGFFINIGSLPLVAEWLPNLSFLRWTFGALAVNEFAGESFTCDFLDPSMCQTEGDQVLDRLNFKGTVEDQVFGMAMMFLGFLVIAVTTLHLNSLKYLEIQEVYALENRE